LSRTSLAERTRTGATRIRIRSMGMGLKRRAYFTLIGTLLGVSVLFAGFPASAGGAQASPPAWTINPRPTGFGTVTVDKNRSHVLVSGTTGNVVEILSYAGALVTTVPNIFGAAGMVVNGDNLYVAESTAGAIVKVDLNNPTNPPVRLAHGINR